MYVLCTLAVLTLQSLFKSRQRNPELEDREEEAREKEARPRSCDCDCADGPHRQGDQGKASPRVWSEKGPERKRRRKVRTLYLRVGNTDHWCGG